jgi:two-component system cell cycle response regulator DivK
MPARILIIEDDPPSAELARYLLSTAGHTLLVTTNGGAGFRAALEESPDLILCDLQLPVLTGYEVARQLLSKPGWRRVPLIAVSAFSMPGDSDKAIAAGFDAYISKPITPESFVSEVEALLPPDLKIG